MFWVVREENNIVCMNPVFGGGDRNVSFPASAGIPAFIYFQPFWRLLAKIHKLSGFSVQVSLHLCGQFVQVLSNTASVHILLFAGCFEEKYKV